MPHERPEFNATYPDRLVALCSPEQARQLLSFDHHRVQVRGRSGVMLTYEWMTQENIAEPLLLKVIFHYSEAHPPAPAEVQTIVDQLAFSREPPD